MRKAHLHEDNHCRFNPVVLDRHLFAAIVQQPAEHPDVASARTARDRASIKDLQLIVEKTRKQAARTKRFDAYAGSRFLTCGCGQKGRQRRSCRCRKGCCAKPAFF